MSDIADFQAAAAARGYTVNYADRTAQAVNELRVVDSRTFDNGTDPGDDVTMYLIDSASGQKGYLIVADSFHTDPGKAAFIDALLAARRGKA